MFRYARIRLTLLYLLIIALISISFSAIIYNDFLYELENRLIHAQSQLRGLSIPRGIAEKILENEVQSARKAVIFRLFVLNGSILFISGIGGYFLAGKTLSPIEEAVEDQKRFIGDASHELRTPLTSLKTEIEVALRDKKLTLKDARHLLKSNLVEIDKMKDLSNYLLTLNRYEVRDESIKGQKIELSEVAISAVKNNSVLAKSKKIRIVKNFEKIRVYGDKNGLVELASILVNNAIKYSPKNSIVAVTTKKAGRCNQLIVSDSGPGIEKKEIPRIFERFYRGDQSRSKTHTEGYGLGLSIAKSIAELHRASINVVAKPGEGAKFIVNFPRYF